MNCYKDMWIVVLLCWISMVTHTSALSLKKVDRTIDISSQIIKVNAIITLENKDAKPASSFLIVLDPESKGSLAFINVEAGDEKLEHEPTVVPSQPSVKHFTVKLPKPLPSGKTIKVSVETVYTHGLEPFPAQITQSQKQLVRYVGSHYIFSPYLVQQQTTRVLLASSSVESYTKLKPSQHTDTTITLGPYENVEQYSHSEMLIHSENNTPFLAVTHLERHIEVSHWGTISVEETIDVLHIGAHLKGAFSRYDYQREHNSGVSSVQQFKTSLPAAASHVYYRDDIGNISTSHLRNQPDEVEVEIRPRFPLFGGWRTHYVIGYTVPIYEYLHRSGDQFVLSMRLLDHVFDDMVVDDFKLSVVLPEGAADIQLRTPYPVHRNPDSLLLTYLDVSGRPVISVTKQNMVESHIQSFELSYHWPLWQLLREPLMVVAAFLLLFLIVCIYVRLDFSITREDSEVVREKVSSLCDKVRNHHDSRCRLYQSMEDSFAKVKSSKDTGIFQATVRSLTTNMKAESGSIGQLQEQVRIEGASDAAERIAELQRQDKALRELLAQHAAASERLVAGKLSKPQYIDQEQQLNKRKEEAVQKMESIVASL